MDPPRSGGQEFSIALRSALLLVVAILESGEYGDAWRLFNDAMQGKLKQEASAGDEEDRGH
jgi:hypothetical protein